MDVVIGLGANIGSCISTLLQARAELSALAYSCVASRLYRTAPVGPEQPDFYNAALRLSTSLGLDAVLAECLVIERRLGRVRAERWGPRTLDLDLLWSKDAVSNHPGLCVPHPRLSERAFALLPLLDVAPEAQHGSLRYALLLPALSEQRCEPIEDPRWRP
jgi:2-amino-4-hydroxy-6-hydroxymethyldihydropteridine diphosphokinase